jgi:hypothetical protein
LHVPHAVWLVADVGQGAKISAFREIRLFLAG